MYKLTKTIDFTVVRLAISGVIIIAIARDALRQTKIIVQAENTGH